MRVRLTSIPISDVWFLSSAWWFDRVILDESNCFFVTIYERVWEGCTCDESNGSKCKCEAEELHFVTGGVVWSFVFLNKLSMMRFFIDDKCFWLLENCRKTDLKVAEQRFALRILRALDKVPDMPRHPLSALQYETMAIRNANSDIQGRGVADFSWLPSLSGRLEPFLIMYCRYVGQRRIFLLVETPTAW